MSSSISSRCYAILFLMCAACEPISSSRIYSIQLISPTRYQYIKTRLSLRFGSIDWAMVSILILSPLLLLRFPSSPSALSLLPLAFSVRCLINLMSPKMENSINALKVFGGSFCSPFLRFRRREKAGDRPLSSMLHDRETDDSHSTHVLCLLT